MDLSKVRRYSYQARLHDKGQLNLATEVLKSFSPGVSDMFCVTHIKSSNNGTSGPIISAFFKVALKATVVNPEN